MARTDDISLYGNWAQGVPNTIVSVDLSTGDFAVPKLTRVIMVSTAGDVAVTMHSGGSDVLPQLQPGISYVFSAKEILQMGTSATGIKLLS